MSNWTFIEHITNYLSRPRLGDKKPPTLWPSEASAIIKNEYGEDVVVGKCRRASFFRYLVDSYNFTDKYSFYEPLVTNLHRNYIPPDSYMQWIWKQGELYEEYCVELAKESGVYIATQTQIYIPQLNVSGKIDLVALNPDTGKYSSVEFKSVYGFNGNVVLGTPGDRRKGILGTPRDSNLMQIGLYQWWYADQDDQFEEGRLVYGSRDTGRYAEYKISIKEDSPKHIIYQGASPAETEPVISPITIESISEQYQSTQLNLDAGIIPPRDFDLVYSEEKIDTLYQRSLLNKADTERYEKRMKQIEDGKKPILPVEKSDWHCSLCSWKKICYNQDNSPREI